MGKAKKSAPKKVTPSTSYQKLDSIKASINDRNSLTADYRRAAVRHFLPNTLNASALGAYLTGDARMTNTSLNDQQRVAMYDMVMNAAKRTGKQSGGTDYSDFKDGKEIKRVLTKSGQNTMGVILGRSFGNDPDYSLATTTGQSTYHIDPRDSSVVVTDEYDFNKEKTGSKPTTTYGYLREGLRAGERIGVLGSEGEKKNMGFILNKKDIEETRSNPFRRVNSVVQNTLQPYWTAAQGLLGISNNEAVPLRIFPNSIFSRQAAERQAEFQKSNLGPMYGKGGQLFSAPPASILSTLSNNPYQFDPNFKPTPPDFSKLPRYNIRRVPSPDMHERDVVSFNSKRYGPLAKTIGNIAVQTALDQVGMPMKTKFPNVPFNNLGAVGRSIGDMGTGQAVNSAVQAGQTLYGITDDVTRGQNPINFNNAYNVGSTVLEGAKNLTPLWGDLGINMIQAAPDLTRNTAIAIDPKNGSYNLVNKTHVPALGLQKQQAIRTALDFPQKKATGGTIHIKPENKGKFTAWAQSHDMGVQEAAKHVMANKEDYSSTIVKRANFAKNAAGWKKLNGGPLLVGNQHVAMGGSLEQFGPGGTLPVIKYTNKEYNSNKDLRQRVQSYKDSADLNTLSTYQAALTKAPDKPFKAISWNAHRTYPIGSDEAQRIKPGYNSLVAALSGDPKNQITFRDTHNYERKGNTLETNIKPTAADARVQQKIREIGNPRITVVQRNSPEFYHQSIDPVLQYREKRQISGQTQGPVNFYYKAPVQPYELVSEPKPPVTNTPTKSTMKKLPSLNSNNKVKLKGSLVDIPIQKAFQTIPQPPTITQPPMENTGGWQIVNGEWKRTPITLQAKSINSVATKAMGGSLYKKYLAGGPFGVEEVDPNNPDSQAMWAQWEAEKQRRRDAGEPERPPVYRVTQDDLNGFSQGAKQLRNANKAAAQLGATATEEERYRAKRDAQDAGIANMSASGIALGSSLVSNMSENNRIKQQGAHNDGSNSAFLGAANGMAKGATMGASFGPIGVAAGAAIGGIAGYIGGNAQGKRLKKEYDAWQGDYRSMEQKRIAGQNSRYQDFRATTSGMYAEGGSLAKPYMAMQKAEGGNLVPLSSDTVEVQGPSHAQGGVQLPGANAEVEGNEVIKDDYVFSDQLGFAKVAKKFAKAKGTIEDKPATRERINSLKLLQDKENHLKLAQEFIRKQNNLQ